MKQKKPFLFLGNPPYATANDAGAKGNHKGGVAKSRIGELMKEKGAGQSSQQLFSQFIWRIAKIKKDFNLPKVVIAFFINPIFFSPSEYWKEFRTDIFSNFEFRTGFLFPAGDFADVSSNWGVSFIVLDSSTAPENLWDENIEHKWEFDALVLDRKNNLIRNIGKKELFHWPSQYSLSSWIRDPIKNLKPVIKGWSCAQLSSGLKCSLSKAKPRGTLILNSIGYMVNVSNNVYKSLTDTWIVNSSAYMGNGVNITPLNFERSVVNFAVRLSVNDNWVTHIDEYHSPDSTKEGYDDFVNDCAIFSLFHAKSNQTSVKDLDGPDQKTYSFVNEWFPWSKNEMAKLANQYKLREMYNEAISDRERFVYKWLQNRKLSQEAQDVLNVAKQVLIKTFPFREACNTTSTSYGPLNLHLQRWDAGWYQIKFLVKALNYEKTPLYENFKIKYARLGKKIQGQISNYGILKDTFGHFTRRPENLEDVQLGNDLTSS